MTRGRRVSIVEGLDLLTMDRLLTARLLYSAPLACQLCAVFFHVSPKKCCRLCGTFVCLDCAEKLLVHGQRWTRGGLRSNPHHPLIATVCLACFHRTFAAHVIGYVESPPDHRPFMQPPRLPPSIRRRGSPQIEDDIPSSNSSHPLPPQAPLVPLQRRVCTPVYGQPGKAACGVSRPFRVHLGPVVECADVNGSSV
ncbi:hypothetical protein H257_05438 [Aphanomyces astaci]|uniref:FYVE-type domain-containing protein n=1 Tax=Aphanomyces astaci TaxID=112090 RepID=W4GQ71_APHAT|nr:hypothetical protein H257_05438 [Aphanomyces astaci]ETV81885.1 hypothetical protein H257_05438 [Aphanomyces astaci]|eukprot:XP_009828622.1 hypothetical protein H257_05438 [Aphanomyces astaci]